MKVASLLPCFKTKKLHIGYIFRHEKCLHSPEEFHTHILHFATQDALLGAHQPNLISFLIYSYRVVSSPSRLHLLPLSHECPTRPLSLLVPVIDAKICALLLRWEVSVPCIISFPCQNWVHGRYDQ
jgi:hypothetical protein